MDLTKYAEVKKKQIQTVRKQFATNIFKSIVLKTPVDTGRARGNWQISIGNDTQNQLERESKNGENIAEETEKTKDVKGDETIYICNNLPYITVLEYGGYPKNVKKGSWDKKTKTYVVKSRNGYSRQAPNGMVGITLGSKEKAIKKAIADSGWSEKTKV